MGVGLVLWKDLRRELRSRDGIMAGIVTVFVFLLLDLFALDEVTDVGVLAFLIWMPLVYGTIAAVGRGMSQEADKGTLEWLLSLPISPNHIALSRTVVDFGLIAFLGACGVLGTWGLYGPSISVNLIIILALASVGLAVVGSLVGALSSHGKQRESLLPMLIIPVLAPLLHSGLAATRSVLAGGNLQSTNALYILIGFDAIMVGAAAILWPITLEEA